MQLLTLQRFSTHKSLILEPTPCRAMGASNPPQTAQKLLLLHRDGFYGKRRTRGRRMVVLCYVINS